MSTIRTYERLDRLPDGATVTVDGQPFIKRGGELHDRTGTGLPLLAFRAYAEEGKVSSGPTTPELPAWYRNYENDYLVLGQNVDGNTFVAIQFRYGVYNNTEAWTDETLSRISRHEGPQQDVPPAQMIVGLKAALPMISGQVPFLGYGAQAQQKSGLVAALQEAAEAMPGLDDILFDHGVGRMRTGEVTVSAKGKAKVSSEQFGGIEVEDTEVGWKFTYDYSASAPISAPCLCGTFDEQKFATRLPMNNVSEEHATVCSEPDCINKKEASK